ncbi:MAG: hypothetical protein RIR97_1879, partial [Pseudomonadota bacterium]
LADKLDTLVGFWAIDEKPTGSKDPYALRRAALGVIRIVLENKVQLGLASIINDADLLSFFHDRLKVYLKDLGARHDLIDAVLSAAPSSGPSDHLLPVGEKRERGATSGSSSPQRGEGGASAPGEGAVETSAPGEGALQKSAPGEGAGFSNANDDFLLVARRVEALTAFITSEDGKNMLAGAKRATQLLAAEEKKGAVVNATVNEALLTLPAEKALHAAIIKAKADAETAVALEDFRAAMAAMAVLREPVDQFFADVLVNDDNADIRANRLALLGQIRATTATVADFSRIAG